MKEFTIEEKAKAYDKALEKARQLCVYPTSKSFINDLQDLFPELKESEDERIRKEIIAYFKADWAEEEGITRPDWIAWLEKQGEQKPADKTEPKFKVGDWVMLDRPVLITKVEDMPYNTHQYWTSDGTWFGDGTKAKLWNIEEAKTGDVLALSYESQNYILIYKGLHEKGFDTIMSVFCSYYVEKDTYDDETDSFHMLNTGEIITPATKEQRDLLFQKMKEAGFEWDAEKKEPKKIDNEEVNGDDYGIDGLYHAQRILEKTLGKVDGYQTDDGILDHKAAITTVKKLYEQKPAWSEEDELSLKQAIYVCHQNGYTAVENWLKSLKGKYTWKPSKEQIMALRWVLNYIPYDSHKEEISGLLDKIKDL